MVGVVGSNPIAPTRCQAPGSSRNQGLFALACRLASCQMGEEGVAALVPDGGEPEGQGTLARAVKSSWASGWLSSCRLPSLRLAPARSPGRLRWIWLLLHKPRFVRAAFPMAQLLLDLVLGCAVSFLNLSRELVAPAGNHVQIIVGRLAPFRGRPPGRIPAFERRPGGRLRPPGRSRPGAQPRRGSRPGRRRGPPSPQEGPGQSPHHGRRLRPRRMDRTVSVLPASRAIGAPGPNGRRSPSGSPRGRPAGPCRG